MVDPNQKQLNFIIGIGRSGTTILNKILNSHPAIHSLPEANFLVFFLHDYKDIKKFNQKHIELIFEQIQLFSLSHPWVGWEFNLQTTKAKLLNLVNKGELSYEELCKIVYSDFKVFGMDKSSSSILVDKNPSYTLFVKHLANHFPKAKFIFLLRDYRANILSRKQSVYLKSPEVAFNSYRWKLFNESSANFSKKHPDKVLLLKYEDLVLDSEKEIVRICEFLGVKKEDFNTQVELDHKVDFSHFNVDEKYKERFQKKYSDLNRPLNSSRLNSWETQLSKSEIELCEAMCSDFAAQFGYQPFCELSSFDKFRIKMTNVIPMLKAWIDVKKDLIIYYFPVAYKLQRFKKSYVKLNFIKK